jgi:hypothetical protein
VFALEAVFITWLIVELVLVGRERRRPARPVAGGRLLTHGASVRLGVGLLAVLVVMAGLIVVMGTARGDVLEAVFGGAVGFWALIAMAMSWTGAFTLRVLLQGDGITVSSYRRGSTTVRWDEIERVDSHPYRGHLELYTAGDRRIRISARLIGAGELAAELQRHVPRSRIEPPAWEQLNWLIKALQET